MSKDFLGKGWRFPVQVDASGSIALSEFEEDVRESIRLVLLTGKGERVMRPGFGAGLHDFVFEVMSSTTLGALQAAVHNALTEWEPRIQVLGVQVKPDSGEVGRLLVDLDYRVRATNSRFNLVFPFYLESAR
jgi:phage baseplate assembly protein W